MTDAEDTVTPPPPKVARRLSIGLTHRADDALRYLIEHTGYNVTDTINRALVLLAMIERRTDPRYHPDTELALVRIDAHKEPEISGLIHYT